MNIKLPLNGGNSTQGERHIESILQQVCKELNFFYNKEVRIGKFKDKTRRADFSFRYNEKLFLIEFDGIQHSQSVEAFGGITTLKEVQARDRWENLTYCPSHNICLIRYKVFSKASTLEEHRDAQSKLLNFITPERLKMDILKADKCKYVQNSVSYGRKKLKIALDIDDTVVDWINAHERKFKCSLSQLTELQITKQVVKCQYDKQFWENLKLVEKPNFIPHCYCTKRISSKSYTKTNLSKLGLPIRPIYQVVYQYANKANYIKGICDVLIDDSWRNVKQCLESGFPALLITRPHNKHISTKYRVNHLNYQEISKKYYELF